MKSTRTFTYKTEENALAQSSMNDRARIRRFFIFTALLMTVMGVKAQVTPTNIKISDAPTNAGWADNTTWYQVRTHRPTGEANSKGWYLRGDACDANGDLLLSNTYREGTREDVGLWCIVGDATSGYKFYNRAKGIDNPLGMRSYTGSARARFVALGTQGYTSVFDFAQSQRTEDGVQLWSIRVHTGNNSTYYWNPQGGYLAVWNNSGATNDDNSAFLFVEAMTTLPELVYNSANMTLTITCTEEHGTIYYTEDGSDPTDTNNKHRKEIHTGENATISTGGTTVKAYAHKAPFSPSAVVEKQMPSISRITSLSEITESNSYYVLTADTNIDGYEQLENFTGVLDGGYHTISGLTKPLFAKATNATIKNVVIKEAQVTGQDNVGAIVGTASGNTRIYNCGVLSGTVSGETNVGSIAGKLVDNARVINCYSFANVSGSGAMGGIVGYNSVASRANNLQTLVMNCMFYGDLSGNGSKAPIYNGEIISNAGNQGINNYNYYRYESPYSKEKKIDESKYNCALAAEERYLVRHEFYRNILNSQRKLCAFYTTGAVEGIEDIGKWVVDKAIAPYPIIKPWSKYTSVINKEIKDDKVLGMLTVTISGYEDGAIQLPITDMDAESHDYNYYKVQLPYYNDYFDNNYTNNQVVTGWKITDITFSNDIEYTSFSTSGDNRYNFADRYCIEKDLNRKTGIVFAQGGYYNVPEGVTAITIEPYWGKAVYLSDATYDVVYSTSYAGTPYSVAGNVPKKFKDQTVYNSLGDVWGNLQNGRTVYDNAIVLVGNYHSYDESWSSSGKSFTIMSVDEDKDNEPDYCLYHHFNANNGRGDIDPARFDFLCIPAIGRAAKVTGSGMSMPNQGIYHPKGWFEVTETSLIRFTEFEYDDGNGKVDSPIILNNGIFEQFVSSFNRNASNTIYIRLGGNIYFEKFTQGTHTDMTHSTKRSPLSITGGEYKEFYLSGEKANAKTVSGNVLCYSNGGFFHTFASANMEDIDGSVIIKMDHSIVKEFYGGGMKEAEVPQIKGDIDITINNSHVDFYCGGPKFGHMAPSKTVTTRAKGTTFGNFYGAGYGGSSYTIVKQLSPYGGDYTGTTYAEALYETYTFKTQTNDGILTDYHLDFFSYAGGRGSLVSRFFNHYARLSLATTNDVTSTLEDCKITGDFYGGGCQGAVEGNVTSILTNCELANNVFAGGFSASIPTCIVRESVPTTYPTYDQNTGVFNKDVLPEPDEYSWSSKVETVDKANKLLPTTEEMLNSLGTVKGNTTLTISGSTKVTGSVYGGGNMSKVIDGQTKVIINGSDVVIQNNVFGGGNQAEVIGNTNVDVKDGRINGNVFGGGNLAEVKGKTTVVIGESNNPEFKFDEIEEEDEIELGAPERDTERHTVTE